MKHLSIDIIVEPSKKNNEFFIILYPEEEDKRATYEYKINLKGQTIHPFPGRRKDSKILCLCCNTEDKNIFESYEGGTLYCTVKPHKSHPYDAYGLVLYPDYDKITDQNAFDKYKEISEETQY